MTKYQVKFLKSIILISSLFFLVSTIILFEDNSNNIKIGTKNLTEQRIYAYYLEDVIESQTNIDVDVITGFDATSFLHNAILHNDIDMYVEYSSTSFLEVFKQTFNEQTPSEIITYIQDEYDKIGLKWLYNIGFDNSNVLICSDFCKENNISTYSELANYDFSFAAPAYFYAREDGYNLLEDTYGKGFLDAKTEKMDIIVEFSAILSGKIDVGLAFSTDAKLKNENIVILEDDLNAFPKYDAGLIVTDDVLNKYPELESILMNLENDLTNEEVISLNNLSENEGYSDQEVAKEYYNLKNNI